MRCDIGVEEIAIPAGWRERLEKLAGRRRETALIAGLVVVITAVSLAAWGRSAPATVAPPAAAAGPTASVGDVAATPVVHVHVAGAVVAPGLYVLPEGARVADAVTAAGGPRRRALLDLLNLAQPLADGMKVEVPRRGDGGIPLPTTPSSVEPGAAGSLVSINSADQQTLEAVPGLGPVKAGAIVRYREEMGPFTALEQVMEVSGIGPATFEQMLPFISL